MFKAILVVAALWLAPGTAAAHDGEDHGEPPAVIAAVAGPSAEATSERHEAVVRLEAGRLTVFLDDFASNAPVTAAKVTAAIGAREIVLRETDPGTYAAAAAVTLPAGDTEIGLTIEAPAGADLLAATLTMPKAVVAAHDHFDWWPFAVGAATGIGGLLLVLGAGRAIARRRRVVAVAAAMAVLIGGGMPDRAVAHDGEDHGETPVMTGAGGSRAVRLPDGRVFLPKPSQRILGLRTIVARAGNGAATASLPATVIADPSLYARVATARGGRLLPLATGFPRLGARVAAGQPLFRVAPSLSATEASASAAARAGLDRDIVLAGQEATRLRALKGIVADAEIRRAEAGLAGLRAQRAAAAGPLSSAETVRAPFAGGIVRVIGNVGEVAAPGQIIVEIAGDGGLLVEALAPMALQGRAISSAEAIAGDGGRFALSLVGRGPAVAGGVERLQFRPRAAAGLRIGTPLTVALGLAGTAARSGVVVPASAVVRGASGETIVWSKRRAELFVPRVVRVAALPGGARLVTAGIAPGDRIVSEAAGLLAQVR